MKTNGLKVKVGDRVTNGVITLLVHGVDDYAAILVPEGDLAEEEYWVRNRHYCPNHHELSAQWSKVEKEGTK